MKDADDNHRSTEGGDRDGSPMSSPRSKWIAFFVLAAVSAAIAYGFGDQLSLESLAARERQLQSFRESHPVAVYGIALVIYVVVTGLSLPGAAALTLIYGWLFGFTRSLVLVSFASTAGATIAFLCSRYLLRDAVEARYKASASSFRKRLADEGAFALFLLRLIPAVPFFLINLAMGLTPIKTRTFWWVSQVGMLPGTAVYVYAGTSVPNLQVLADQGVTAVFEPRQLIQLTLAFALIGIFPLAVRLVIAAWGVRGDVPR